MRAPSIVLLSVIVLAFFGSVGCIGAEGSADPGAGEEEDAAQASRAITGGARLRNKSATGTCLATSYQEGAPYANLTTSPCQSAAAPAWSLSKNGVLYAHVPAVTRFVDVNEDGTWVSLPEVESATVCVRFASLRPQIPPFVLLRTCDPATTKDTSFEWSLQSNGEIRSVSSPTTCLTLTATGVGLATCDSKSTKDEWAFF